MEEYVVQNRVAYDLLADQYRRRADADRVRDSQLIRPFTDYILDTFGLGARVADLGSGNGINVAMFRNEGFYAVGIDISSKMIEVARSFCPGAKWIVGDLTELPFPPNSFHGVFAKASLHLMPKSKALEVLARIRCILHKRGMLYVTTTVESRSEEGYSVKRDYPYGVMRYRKHWTENELADAIHCSNFNIHKHSTNYEVDRGKQWFNIWAVRD